MKSPGQPTMSATRSPQGRAPTQIDGHRTCLVETCDTVLSKYNKKQFCHKHWPVTFPVQRGLEKSAA